MDSMAGIIGCEPTLTQYFFTDPLLWMKMVYGATQATQFRLCGPGAKISYAKKILRKLPVSEVNYIVKAGIRGRISYMLKPKEHRKLFNVLFEASFALPLGIIAYHAVLRLTSNHLV